MYAWHLAMHELLYPPWLLGISQTQHLVITIHMGHQPLCSSPPASTTCMHQTKTHSFVITAKCSCADTAPPSTERRPSTERLSLIERLPFVRGQATFPAAAPTDDPAQSLGRVSPPPSPVLPRSVSSKPSCRFPSCGPRADFRSVRRTHVTPSLPQPTLEVIT